MYKGIWEAHIKSNLHLHYFSPHLSKVTGFNLNKKDGKRQPIHIPGRSNRAEQGHEQEFFNYLLLLLFGQQTLLLTYFRAHSTYLFHVSAPSR